MKWTDKKIVAWHKKTFPDADLKSQKIKFLEEYREYLESGDITELADMFIVNAVLTHRFSYGRFSNIVYEELLKDDYLFNIQGFVDRKMDINAKRTWCKVNGVYRHINKKNDYIGGKSPIRCKKCENKHKIRGKM